MVPFTASANPTWFQHQRPEIHTHHNTDSQADCFSGQIKKLSFLSVFASVHTMFFLQDDFTAQLPLSNPETAHSSSCKTQKSKYHSEH